MAMKLPKKDVLKWFSKNYGIGGFENYTESQVQNVLQAIYLLLQSCGNAELYFLGKFLLKLSDNPKLQEDLFQDLQDLN